MLLEHAVDSLPGLFRLQVSFSLCTLWTSSRTLKRTGRDVEPCYLPPLSVQFCAGCNMTSRPAEVFAASVNLKMGVVYAPS